MIKYENIWQTKTYWYAYNVVYGDTVACVDVVNACKRFLNDLERMKSDDFPFYFDLSNPQSLNEYHPIHLQPFQ